VADGGLDVTVGSCVDDVGVEDGSGAVTVAVVDTWVVLVEVDSTDDETVSFPFPHANPIEPHTTNVAGSRQPKGGRASGWRLMVPPEVELIFHLIHDTKRLSVG
jgi:hypothetical protein